MYSRDLYHSLLLFELQTNWTFSIILKNWTSVSRTYCETYCDSPFVVSHTAGEPVWYPNVKSIFLLCPGHHAHQYSSMVNLLTMGNLLSSDHVLTKSHIELCYMVIWPTLKQQVILTCLLVFFTLNGFPLQSSQLFYPLYLTGEDIDSCLSRCDLPLNESHAQYSNLSPWVHSLQL